MIKLYPKILAAALTLCVFSAKSQPADNPLASHYGAEGYPAFSDLIKWNNVITMQNKGDGVANFNEFEAKRDELVASGGGVLYYPAGTYQFTVPEGPNGRGLLLKSGVVIRGALPPADDRYANIITDVSQLTDFTKYGLKSNPTKFVFTRLDFTDSVNVRKSSDMDGTTPKAMVPSTWAMIGCTPANADLVGIAWVEIEYGYIWFGHDVEGGWTTWGTRRGFAGDAKGEWNNRMADGTHPIDVFAGAFANATGTHSTVPYIKGSKRFVFGVHLKNSTLSNYMMNKWGFGATQNPNWKLEPGGWQFGPRIGVVGKDIFIANNTISKPTSWFVFDMLAIKGNGWPGGTPDLVTVDQVFNYANCLGIDVNKSLNTYNLNRCVVDDPNSGFYSPNIIIKENYIYNHGNKNYEVAGKWAVIKDNVAAKQPIFYTNVYDNNTTFDCACLVHKSSYKAHRATSAEDYMNRGFDYGGWNLWFHNNWFAGTGSQGNDGEGILCQRHNGVEAYSITMTANKQHPTSGQNGYLAPYDVHCIGLLHGWNSQRGSVGVAKPEHNYISDVAVLKNVSPATNLANNVTGANGANVQDFLNEECLPGRAVPGQPQITLSNESGYVEIAWDNVDNEVGYAVQRRIKGNTTWRTVVFRPRQETLDSVFFGGDNTNADRLLGRIRVTANMGPGSTDHCWDEKMRRMNEARWNDYTTVAGTFEYRVIALACDIAGADGTSSAIEEIIISSVAAGNSAASKPVTFIPVKVFPNPVVAGTKVEYTAEGPVDITMMDYTGKVVKTLAKGTTDGFAPVDASGLKTGVYVIEVKSANGATRTKVVVE